MAVFMEILQNMSFCIQNFLQPKSRNYQKIQKKRKLRYFISNNLKDEPFTGLCCFSAGLGFCVVLVPTAGWKVDINGKRAERMGKSQN